MTEPKYPYATVAVQIEGPQGNAFYILGAVAAELRDMDVDGGEIDEYVKEAMAGDYENLLRVTREWVDFVEV